MEVAPSAEQLVGACREYKSGVYGLLDALEKDVYRAADHCWRLQDTQVQLRGGVLRHKSVVLQEPTFQSEVEQHELAGALEQWRNAVQGVAAAAVLQMRVAEQQLVLDVARALHEEAGSPGPLLAVVGALLGAYDGLLSLQQRELHGTLSLLTQLAVQVAAAWRSAGGGDATDVLAAHEAAPPEVIAALTAPAAAPALEAGAAAGESGPGGEPPAAAPSDQAALPPGVPPELAASLAQLSQRQAELAEDLEGAAQMLRFWGRRGEKAAAGTEAVGREGDVPPMLVEAQQLLWAACQTYEEEQAAADVATRQLVCQRYRPADVAALQQRADEFADGQRLSAQQALEFEPEFVQLRGRARTLAARFVQEQALVKAAQHLHQLRYLLLEAQLPPESAAARQQLLLRVAEALLDGSTPPAAVPLLAALLQQGLQAAGGEGGGQSAGVSLSDQDKARLVPMICRGLAQQQASRRALLRQPEALGLLRSFLQPDALLNDGQLAQFFSMLKLVAYASASAGLPEDGTRSLLAVFDASRFAVLVCQQEAAAAASPTASGATGVSMQQLLDLAHRCLAVPGADGVGMGLLEGVLTLQPASYLAAALQLALACGTQAGRAGVLGMLCRVPTELLPPAVLADALIQLTEAVDGNQLAPPFLPYDLISRLYRSRPVLGSLQLATERGAEAAAAAAAAEAAAAPRDLWTVRVGGSAVDLEPLTSAEAEVAQYFTASGSTAQPAGGEAAAAAGAAGAPGPTSGSSPLLLLPLQTSAEPLAVVLQRLVGALLSSLLRRAGGALDAASLSEELMQLLGLLMTPAAAEGPWMLTWLWSQVYQEALRPFLADASVAVEGAGGSGLLAAAFSSYWASLPWRQATFHSASPGALTALRMHLVAAAVDGAAAVLLRELDFAAVIAKAAPQVQSPRVDQVYSLAEDEEEEAGSGDAADERSRGCWAAELGLLVLHACVLMPEQDQPDWLRQLLHGVSAQQAQQVEQQAEGGAEAEVHAHALMRSPLSTALLPLAAAAGEQQPLLPHLLAAADWRRLAAAMHAEVAAAGDAAPWLLLPALLAPAHLGAGDLGSRAVHAAILLSHAAVLTGTAQAARCAAGAAGALLLCTLCQGERHAEPQAAPQRQPQAAAAVPAVPEQQEQVVIPEGFPLDLLADTVEGHQLLLLQQQQREQAELATAAAAAAAAEGGSQAGGGAHDEGQGGGQPGAQQAQQALPLVEVNGCWSLTAGQHVQLLQQALLPLAASHASLALAAGLQPEHCPAELAVVDSRQGAAGVLAQWRHPGLSQLLQAASAAADAADSSAAAAASDVAGAAGERDGMDAAAAGLAAVLLPLARQPVTVLTGDSLPYANTELPLDTQAALFVSVAPEASGAHRHQRRPLAQALSSLLPGSEARRRAQQAECTATADAGVIQNQLLLAVQAACKQPAGGPMAACLLRLAYACPSLHPCARAMQLSEGLLRFMAAPDQDAGPLGRGAAASAAVYQRPGSAASEVASDAVSMSAHSAAAEVIPLEAAGEPGEGTAAPTPDAAGRGSGGSAGASQLAVVAAQGLPPPTLVAVATSAAELQAPLTAALAVEQLRQGTTVLPKDDWQALAAEVLRVALRAGSEPAHPFDLVAVWLSALPWVADSRWRRLASGPHLDALLEWLESLELRVMALRLAQPDDFGAESPGGGSPHRLLSTTVDRLQSLGQRIAGGSPSPGRAAADGGGAGAGPPSPRVLQPPGAADAGAAGGGEERKLGQRLGKGIRSLLGGKKSAGEGDGGPQDSGAPPPPGEGAAGGQGSPGGKVKWGDKVRHRLAKMGIGHDQEDAAAAAAAGGTLLPQSGLPEPAHARPALPPPYQYPGPSLGTVAEESGPSGAGMEAPLPPSDAGHLGIAAGAAGGPGGPGGSGGSVGQVGQAVGKKISSGFQAVGRGLSKVKTKLTADRPGGSGHARSASTDVLADRDQDMAIRLGLAAFAVSAYIKSVLCPSLTTPRPGDYSAGPATPTTRLDGAPAVAGAAQRTFSHRSSSSFGRWQDAEYLRELDRVLEARSELDSLESLAACPLLQMHPAACEAFIAEVPALLSAGTPVGAFAARLAHLLFEEDERLLLAFLG